MFRRGCSDLQGAQYLSLIHILDSVGRELANTAKGWAAAMLDSGFSTVSNIVNGVFEFVIGLVFAIYILLQKEKLEMCIRDSEESELKIGAPNPENVIHEPTYHFVNVDKNEDVNRDELEAILVAKIIKDHLGCLLYTSRCV